jgi:hypothetical protein
MNTLVDFITQNKGIEYLLAIAFIGGYALFVEYLKPKPFRGLVSSIRDDMGHMKGHGKADMRRLMKNMLVLPFVAGAYMVALPFYMFVGMGLRAEEALSRTLGGGSMAWRPLEAYLSGRSRKRGKKVQSSQNEEEGKR